VDSTAGDDFVGLHGKKILTNMDNILNVYGVKGIF
jgi:hypothetical protein